MCFGVHGIQLEPLRKAIADVGEDISHLKRIILTHQDIDHIGNVHALLDLLPNTALLAHKDDIPYMTGDLPFVKLTTERINQMDTVLREKAEDMIRRLPDLRFAHALEDGEHLPYKQGFFIIRFSTLKCTLYRRTKPFRSIIALI